jgi:hypothetical protein
VSSEHILNVRIIEEYKELMLVETEDHKNVEFTISLILYMIFSNVIHHIKIILLRSAQITTSLRLSQSTILYKLNENSVRRQSLHNEICLLYTE